MSNLPSSQRVSLGVLGWLNRLLVVLISMAVVGAMGLRYVPLIRQNQMMRADVQLQQDKVDRLKSEVSRLEAEIRALKTDPRTVERRLRELGYARPDEVVVTFREPSH